MSINNIILHNVVMAVEEMAMQIEIKNGMINESAEFSVEMENRDKLSSDM